MTNAGYQQAPTISSSRKIDLNTSFKLVPEGFDSTRNKKRSLLIGCNYENHSEATLKSCHDDIRSVKDYIVNVHGFSESNDLMTVLLDDDNHKPPTHHNIVEALKSLSEKSKPGDAIFLQFTGHGSRVLDIAVGSEAECYDEILLPSDYRTSGFIRDTLIFKTLLAPMCHGAHMTILLDSSDTGVMVDLPYAWSTRGDKPDTLAKVSLNDDFSFLRFLKVVKSMYEMSTFTRLGKTVNSALDKKRGSSAGETVIPEDEDDESAAAGSLITVDENSKSTQNNKESTTKNESLFKTLTSCYNTEIKENIDNSNTKNVQSKANGSLFQKVLSCGLLNNNAASDDEVLFNQVNSVSLDEDDMDTFDGRTVGSDDGTLETTFTEDFNDRNRRRRNNGYCA
uniref:Peptidase C14 caspase domain-containing protein n=1 Tax=Eucampia antarctica TaxID=49252 RepID=A0A7S2RND8_9STRA